MGNGAGTARGFLAQRAKFAAELLRGSLTYVVSGLRVGNYTWGLFKEFEVCVMERNQAKGKWKQLTANVKQEWAELTDDEVGKAEGNFDELVARIQEKYGESRETIARKLNKMME